MIPTTLRILFTRKPKHIHPYAAGLESLGNSQPKSAFSDLAPEILADDIRAVMAMEEKNAQTLSEFNDEG